MSKKTRTEAVDYLFQAILSLENKEECYTFLKIFVRSMNCFPLSQRFEEGENVKRAENLFGDSGKDRRLYRHYQQGKPFFELWK